jgi:hypothetical protein
MATKKQELKVEKKQPNFFVRMFMDENDINEKSIVGFGSFIMMVICLGVDIWTGFHGQEMPINEFVFDGFMYITLGSFGIASVDKFVSAKKGNASSTEEEAY